MTLNRRRDPCPLTSSVTLMRALKRRLNETSNRQELPRIGPIKLPPFHVCMYTCFVLTANFITVNYRATGASANMHALVAHQILAWRWKRDASREIRDKSGSTRWLVPLICCQTLSEFLFVVPFIVESTGTYGAKKLRVKKTLIIWNN